MPKTCFVISVIGEKGSDERRYADKLLKYLISPVAEPAGYNLLRADHIDESGMIGIQVVEAILNSELVIADLTYPNPNVYYELAVRHSTGKPLVHLVQDKIRLPFDVNQVRSVQYSFEVDEIDACREDLAKKIRAAEADKGMVLNPITQAREVNQLKTSSDTTQQLMARVIEGQSAMANALNLLVQQSSLGYSDTGLGGHLQPRNSLFILGRTPVGTNALLGGLPAYTAPTPKQPPTENKSDKPSPEDPPKR